MIKRDVFAFILIGMPCLAFFCWKVINYESQMDQYNEKYASEFCESATETLSLDGKGFVKTNSVTGAAEVSTYIIEWTDYQERELKCTVERFKSRFVIVNMDYNGRDYTAELKEVGKNVSTYQ